jgi:hypothetical protein
MPKGCMGREFVIGSAAPPWIHLHFDKGVLGDRCLTDGKKVRVELGRIGFLAKVKDSIHVGVSYLFENPRTVANEDIWIDTNQSPSHIGLEPMFLHSTASFRPILAPIW